MSKTRKPPVDRAVATIRERASTDVRKVSVARTISANMAKGSDWGAATDVQNAVSIWTGTADAIDANALLIAGLHAQLKTADAHQNALRRDWQAAKVQVASTVTVFCGGSADKVRGFCVDVLRHNRLGLLDAPADLTVDPGAALGEVAAAWAKGVARHGFLAQHASDPTNPATISAVIACTRPRLGLGGLTPGAIVSVRVATIDPASPTGQSPWSAWVVGNAR
jgi:hypothetical protein